MNISDEDIELGKQLIDDLPIDVISEKLEVPLYDLANAILDCDFKMPRSVFNLRVKKGKIRFEEGAIERYCVRCKDYHPFTLDFWHHNRNTNDGSHTMCRACEHERKENQRMAKKQLH